VLPAFAGWSKFWVARQFDFRDCFVTSASGTPCSEWLPWRLLWCAIWCRPPELLRHNGAQENRHFLVKWMSVRA
jgi:hypothetical protein